MCVSPAFPLTPKQTLAGLAGAAAFFGWLPAPYAAKLTAGATVMVYALVGTPEFVDVAYELAQLRLNIHVLTTLAVFGTVALGCALEGALLLVLFATAHAVEERLSHTAAGDLRALWARVPAQATTVEWTPTGPDLSTAQAVSCADVAPGAMLLVRAGTQVPLDGVVMHGSALLSLEHLTGEAAPIAVRLNDEVPAGATNADGVLVIKATRRLADSTPARIARLTAAAQQRRPRVQRLLDTLSDKYSLCVLLLTFCIAAAGPSVLGIPFAGSGGAMYRAFAFLSAAAPCALLMAPLAYVAAIGAAAQRGALVRGGLTLDALADCGAVALDKTGTLTTGILGLTGIQTVEAGRSQASSSVDAPHNLVPLAAAVALERRTAHPVARAVLAAAEASPMAVPDAEVREFKALHGAGVEGVLTLSSGPATLHARFGSVDYVAELCTAEEAASLRHAAGGSERTDVVSALLLAPITGASAQRHLRLFFFSDSVKDRAAAAVAALRDGRGMPGGIAPRVVMLTGDNGPSALSVASRLGLPPADVRSGLSPLDKMRAIEALRGELCQPGWKGGSRVLMVGDGINDAPALAAADVGVAIAATPSEAAAAAADVLLLSTNSVALLPELLLLARKTRAIVRQNIIIAGLSIAAAALPAVAGVFPLWLAVLLHEGSTLLVAVNSVRLLAPTPGAAARAVLGFLGRAARAAALPLSAAAVGLAICVAIRPVVAAVLEWALNAQLARSALQVAQSAWAGLAAGALHTLTGPDHLAALTPLTIGRSRLQSTLLGGLWGCGHNTGQIIVGAVFLALRDRLNLDLLEVGSKVAVGATLTLIGVMGAREALGPKDEGHEQHHHHIEDDLPKWMTALLGSAAGAAKGTQGQQPAGGAPRKFVLATYATGVVHGLQPDALLVLLPSLALPRAAAAAYLATFLLGTVLAMASYTLFIGAGTERLRRAAPGITRRISLVSSAVALWVGALLLVGALFPGAAALLPFGH